MSSPLSLRSLRAWRAGLAGLVAAFSLVACGGGSGGVDTGGTGAFSVGRISGFGSIIVNGVRYDDSSANVQDDDGNDLKGQLKLGMVVEVQGTAPTPGAAGELPRSTASHVEVSSVVKGPVTAASSNALTVLGQSVTLTASTVLDLGSVAAADLEGRVVEVYGYPSASGPIVATRVELESSAPAFYKLTGFVSNANTSGGTTTFTLGGASLTYTGALPEGFANGRLVRVKLRADSPAPAVWTATEIRVRKVYDDHAEAEVEGVVTSYTSAGDFTVNGLRVDASRATFEGSGTLAAGVRVEVEGAIQNGVLIARKVEFEDDESEDEREIELHGAVSGFTAETGSSASFVVRGVAVRVDGTTTYKDGLSFGALANSLAVEVKGRLDTDGATVIATEVKRDD